MQHHIRYPKNFLTEVIARVDFPSPVVQIASQLPKALTQEALKLYPISEPTKALAQELQVTSAGVSSRQAEFTEWRFFGKNREKALTLSSQACFVRYTKYTSYETLRSDFLAPLSAFSTQFPDVVVGRLGLRYINNINLPNGDPLDWHGLINDRMLSIFDVYNQRQAIARAFHILEFNFGDFNLRFQYGMHNPDYPARIRKRVFVLDFDAYQQGLIAQEDIARDLDAYHARVQELFELSILDRLREIMNG